MKIPFALPQSLKSRLTILTVLMVVASAALVASYAKALLFQEALRFTGEQQRSALAVIRTEVQQGLQDRLDALQASAAQLGAQALDSPQHARSLLREPSSLNSLFNAGLMFYRSSGQPLAEVCFRPGGCAAAGPVMDPADLDRILKQGERVIGSVRRDAALASGLLALGAPVRDPQGVVVGALLGVIRLDQPNFLSQLVGHAYGQSGHFFLIEPRRRLIFATSDTARRMEVLPPEGQNPWIDRFMHGFEGTVQAVNPHGREVLVSVQQIPLAGWYASVTISPDEAFGLITAVQPRLRLVAALMLLTLAGLTVWLVRRQLAPMTLAVQTLDGFTRQNQPPQALPVFRNDEVDALVGGFNRLLNTLAQQQQQLRDSEAFKQSILNSVTARIAVLNHAGVIIAVNEAWQTPASAADEGARNPPADLPAPAAGAPAGLAPGGAAVGTPYLSICASLDLVCEQGRAASLADAIRAVLDGSAPRVFLEVGERAVPVERWWSVSVTALPGAQGPGAVISVEDISQRMNALQQVRELAFYDPLTRLPNRRLVLERLAQHIGQSRRKLRRLGLLFIDLDKFKPVNDTLGHAVGDWLLQSVAQRIQSCLRASDTAARVGGDEFVVLLPEVAHSEATVAVAEKIRALVSQEYLTPKGMVLNIAASVGVAVFPDHGQTDKELLHAGDLAMYQAKKNASGVAVCERPVVAPRAAPGPGPAPGHTFVHLRWKPAFASGEPAIDAEHRGLFDQVNGLLDLAARSDAGLEPLEAAFAGLMAHTRAHFCHEEDLLRSLGWPQADAHAQQHQALLTRSHALFDALRANPQDSAALHALLRFLLADLVANHLLSADQAYFGFLKPAT